VSGEQSGFRRPRLRREKGREGKENSRAKVQGSRLVRSVLGSGFWPSSAKNSKFKKGTRCSCSVGSCYSRSEGQKNLHVKGLFLGLQWQQQQQ
jgi:hypothetical protein